MNILNNICLRHFIMKEQDTQESSTQGSDAAPGTGEMEGSKAEKDVTDADSLKEQEQDMPSQADGDESAGKVRLCFIGCHRCDGTNATFMC